VCSNVPLITADVSILLTTRRTDVSLVISVRQFMYLHTPCTRFTVGQNTTDKLTATNDWLKITCLRLELADRNY